MDLSKAERLEKDFLSRRSSFMDTLASEFWGPQSALQEIRNRHGKQG